jgi:hypothetical protein
MSKILKELSPQLRNRAAKKAAIKYGYDRQGFKLKDHSKNDDFKLPDEFKASKLKDQVRYFSEVPKEYKNKLQAIVDEINKHAENILVYDKHYKMYHALKFSGSVGKSIFFDSSDDTGPFSENDPAYIVATIRDSGLVEPKKGFSKEGKRIISTDDYYRNVSNFDGRNNSIFGVWSYKNPTDSKPFLETKMGFFDYLELPSSLRSKLIRFFNTLKAEIIKDPKIDKLKDTSYSDWANADDKDKYLEEETNNYKQLSEIEKKKLGQKILRGFEFLSTGLKDKKLTREKALGLFKDLLNSIYDTGVVNKQVLVKVVHDLPSQKPKPNQQDKSKDITLEDIQKLLKLIKESKGKSSKKGQPKQEEPKEEPVDSYKAVSDFLDSSVGKTFKQRLSRMSSSREKADAIIQLVSKLPGMGIADVRRSVSNKFKTKD